jgi:hypothetical protein
MSLGIGAIDPLKTWTKNARFAATFTQDPASIAAHFQQTTPLPNNVIA